jgi:Mg-chelatase subunit ChlD
MKKDIAVIRESITKVVALLTRRSIKVTQRGSKAFVQYNARSGAIELVNIPYLPDDASDEFVAAVQGFLDHEVGHVLFTDPKIMPTLRKESGKVKNLANAIEDVFIERKMADAFAGSVGNLNSVRRFYLDKIAKPKIDAAIKSGDTNTAAAYAGLVQFRAWGGQRMAIDFLKDNPEYAALAKPMADKLGPELIEKIKKANNSWECLDLARAMKKKLEEKPPEPEGDAPEDDGEAPDSGKGEGEKSKAPATDEAPDEPNPPEEDDDKPPAEDEGSVRTEADDSGKERDERSETEEEVDPEAGESGGPDSSDREPGEDDDATPEDSDSDSEGDGEDGDSDTSESAEKEEGADSFGEGGAGESEDGDVDGESGDGEESDEGGSDDTTDDGADTAPDADGEKKGTDEDKSKDEDGDLSDLFEESRDFDEDMSKALTSEAVREMGESKYQVFSTDWDQILPAPKAVNESSIEAMVGKTQHMVASIQKALERALAAKAKKTWNPGQRRGRISPGALFKTAVGDDRVFRQRYETQAKNTAVSLLVDCSGSMQWADKIGTAALAAFALSSTLERLKINHEVIGFTTRESKPMIAAMKAEGLGVTYARKEALYMPVFKGFKERLGVDAKSRIAHLTERRDVGWLNENVDGECLQIAARRLKTQIAERHLLIVLSDGSPACPGNWHALHGHLKDVAKGLAKDDGIEVIGIGIQDGSVRGYYDKHVVLNDLADLPTTVVAELAKVLLAP